MKKLSGKLALVTGASKGIGAGIAVALADQGAVVVVVYANDQAGADKTAQKIRANGGTASAFRNDVSNLPSTKRMFEKLSAQYGKFDIIVNNAGVFKFEAIEAVTEATLSHHFATNVFGMYYVIQSCLPHLNLQHSSIINIGSIAGENPAAGMSVYSSSKGAVDSLTKALSRELGPRGIRVNSVNPGHTKTEGTDSAGGFEGEFGSMIIAGTPLSRLGSPEDVAKAVVFLASDEASWITGEILRASGGAKGLGY